MRSAELVPTSHTTDTVVSQVLYSANGGLKYVEGSVTYAAAFLDETSQSIAFVSSTSLFCTTSSKNRVRSVPRSQTGRVTTAVIFCISPPPIRKHHVSLHHRTHALRAVPGYLRRTSHDSAPLCNTHRGPAVLSGAKKGSEDAACREMSQAPRGQRHATGTNGACLSDAGAHGSREPFAWWRRSCMRRAARRREGDLWFG